MKKNRTPIELPDPWARTGISQSRYEDNANIRRSRKHSAIVKSANKSISLAEKRSKELRHLARSRRELIPIIARRIVSLRDNSEQLRWEIKLADSGDDIAPWHTVVFYSETLRVLADRPLE